jgi:hypothetical protein
MLKNINKKLMILLCFAVKSNGIGFLALQQNNQNLSTERNPINTYSLRQMMPIVFCENTVRLNDLIIELLNRNNENNIDMTDFRYLAFEYTTKLKNFIDANQNNNILINQFINQYSSQVNGIYNSFGETLNSDNLSNIRNFILNSYIHLHRTLSDLSAAL